MARSGGSAFVSASKSMRRGRLGQRNQNVAPPHRARVPTHTCPPRLTTSLRTTDSPMPVPSTVSREARVWKIPNAFVVTGVDAGSVVGDGKRERFALVDHAEAHLGVRAHHVLQGIADEVHPHLLEGHLLGAEDRHTVVDPDHPWRHGHELNRLLEERTHVEDLRGVGDPTRPQSTPGFRR